MKLGKSSLYLVCIVAVLLVIFGGVTYAGQSIFNITVNVDTVRDDDDYVFYKSLNDTLLSMNGTTVQGVQQFLESMNGSTLKEMKQEIEDMNGTTLQNMQQFLESMNISISSNNALVYDFLVNTMNPTLNNVYSNVSAIWAEMNCENAVNSTICATLTEILIDTSDMQPRIVNIEGTLLPGIQADVDSLQVEVDSIESIVNSTKDTVDLIWQFNNCTDATVTPLCQYLVDINSSVYGLDASSWNQLLIDINQTTNFLWSKFQRTDESVVVFENVTVNTITTAEGKLQIEYGVNAPLKEGYVVGDFVPIKIQYWFIDADTYQCKSQLKYESADPYCKPLEVQTLGQIGSDHLFTVDLHPLVTAGTTYTVVREIWVDPVENGEPVWVKYASNVLIEEFTPTASTDEAVIDVVTAEKIGGAGSSGVLVYVIAGIVLLGIIVTVWRRKS